MTQIILKTHLLVLTSALTSALTLPVLTSASVSTASTLLQATFMWFVPLGHLVRYQRRNFIDTVNAI